MFMRLLQASLVAAALLATTSAGHAQSAYDYPWCAVYTSDTGAGGARSCYYATYAQCMQTMSGMGGFCTRSPYYDERHHDDRRLRRAPRD
jgi:hypothetical protein